MVKIDLTNAEIPKANVPNFPQRAIPRSMKHTDPKRSSITEKDPLPFARKMTPIGHEIKVRKEPAFSHLRRPPAPEKAPE
jgi:hypothetical protein